MNAPRLDNYIEVHDRIAAFKEKYPDGSLRCGKWYVREFGEQTFLVYQALAYRTPRDTMPGEGWAWEPFPGRTPYTKGSELMNAETSAWGRALAALGFEVHRGIASANEVRARQDDAVSNKEAFGPSPKQLDFMKRLLTQHGISETESLNFTAYAKANLAGGRGNSMSTALDKLKENPDEYLPRLKEAVDKWQSMQTDVPGDDADLPTVEMALEDVPTQKSETLL